MLNKQSSCGRFMVWPFKKIKEDFNSNQLAEMGILPEYRTAFNMGRGKLKKDVKRHSAEITENIIRTRELEQKIDNLGIERKRLNAARDRLLERSDAETSIELRDVVSDLKVTTTQFERFVTDKQKTKMRNVELDVTINLLNGIISKRYKTVNDAVKNVNDYRATLDDWEMDKLAPEDAIINKIPEKKTDDSKDDSSDSDSFDAEA
jgi:hypothetical protein